MCPSILSTQAPTKMTSFLSVTPSEIPSQPRQETGFHFLRMAWSLDADAHENPRPRIHWLVD